MSNRTRLAKRKPVEPLPVVITYDDIDIDEQNSVVNLVGEVGKPIAASQFYASGGNGAPTWSTTNGALPGGSSPINSSTGIIGGFTPTVEGTYQFTLVATDVDGRHGEFVLTYVVYPALAVTLTPTIAGVGLGYNLSPIITGSGVDPKTFAITSGAMPTGFSLDSATGDITEDDITATPGDYTFNYRITDSNPGTPAVVNLSRTITVSAAQDATLDFSTSGGLLRQTVIPGTNFFVDTLDTTGVWWTADIHCENAPDGSKAVFSFSNINTPGDYIWIGEKVSGKLGAGFRVGSGTEVAIACPTAVAEGWHKVTLRFYLNGSGRNVAELLVDGQVKATATFSVSFPAWDFSAYNTIVLGGVSRSLGTTLEFNHQAAGFAWGTGDPTEAHEFAYAGGVSVPIDTYDFDGDATCDLNGYWPMVFPAAGSLVIATDADALVDTVGSLDTWSETGSVLLGDFRAPFFNTSFVPANPVPTIPVGAPSTMTFTSTLPAGGVWSGIQYDLTKIGIWASNNGYGALGITSATAVIAGLTATTTIQFNRTIFLGEEITFDFLAGWLFDTFNNKPAAISGTATNNSTTAVPATTAKASWGKISWEISAARPIRFSLEGCPHWNVSVAAGGGVNMIAITPAMVEIPDAAQTANGGMHTLNGSMLNAKRYPNRLAFDSKNLSWYRPLLKIPPFAVDVHDCVISSISKPVAGYPGSYPNTRVHHQSFVHFTDGLIGTTEIARAAAGYDGTAARRAVTAPDINAIAAALSTYSTAGITAANVPDISELVWRFCRVNMTMGLETAMLARTQMTPSFIAYNNSGYGEHIGLTYGAVMLALISDMDVIQKRKLVLWCIHNGHQTYEAVTRKIGANVAALPGNGGHNQCLLPWLVAYLYWTGQKNLIATIYSNPPAGVGTLNEGGQDYLYTAQILADMLPHDRPVVASTKAIYAKRHAITAVSGTTITIQGLVGVEHDVFHRDLNMIRESDGAFAYCVDYTVRTGDKTFLIDAQPSPTPFAVNDIVYFGTSYPISVGQAGWWEGQLFANWGNPSKDLNYRTLQYRSATVMFLRATGLMHANFLATEAYCEMAVASDTPAATNGHSHDFWTVHKGYQKLAGPPAVPFAADFWNIHWDDIKLVAVDPTI